MVYLLPRLRPLQQRKVISILTRNGFKECGGTKHIKFKKFRDGTHPLVTFVPRDREIRVPLIKQIINQSEKPRDEFY
jgi:predicted RNA binding protein YcfA (HicA-like mRNA interferase family)